MSVFCFAANRRQMRRGYSLHPSDLSACALSDWYAKHEAICRIMAESFQLASKINLSMSPDDLSLTDFVFLTRFIDEIEGLPEAIEVWAKRNQISCSVKERIERG